MLDDQLVIHNHVTEEEIKIPRDPNYGLNKEIKVQLRRGKQGKLEYFSNN